MKKRIFIFLVIVFSILFETVSEIHDTQQITSYEQYIYETSHGGSNPPGGNPPGSSGGGSNPNGGGGPSGGGGDNSGGQSQADSLNAEKNEIAAEVGNVETAVNGIEVGEASEASDTALEMAEGNAEALNQVEQQAEQNTQDNIQNLADEKNSENSDTPGDPVKITKGTYELLEQDIITGVQNQFAIKRKYESGNKITGSFGTGWQTNLDERIILGEESNLAEKVYLTYMYLTNLDNIIWNLERAFCSSYKVSSIYNAEEEISARIAACDTQLEALESIFQKISKLQEKSSHYWNSSFKSQINELDTSTKLLKQIAEEKKENLQELYENIDNDMQALSQLKEKRAFIEEKLNEEREIFEENNQKTKRNKKVMFPGMADSYVCTGRNTIIIIDENGYPHILYESSENNKEWKNQKDKRFVKCEKTESGFLVYESDGVIKNFDEAGFIIKLTDRNENYVNILRDDSEKIISIKTSNGEELSFEYKENLITKITNIRSQNENIIYEYEGKRLISVKDTEDDTVYMSYDSSGNLISLDKCDGSSVKYVYGEQTPEGKMLVTETINEEGLSERFIYDFANKKTDYINHDGDKTSYWYDENQRTIKELHSDGAVIEKSYDDEGNLVHINENGMGIWYQYDEKGNKIRADYSDGSYEVWNYDVYNLVTSYVDRDGFQENYLRDPKGNLIKYEKGGEKVFTQEFDSRGRIIKKTVYSQYPIITDYSYDTFGNIESEICGGVKKHYEYDNRNRLVKVFVNNTLQYKCEYKRHEVKKKYKNGFEVTLLTNGRKDMTGLVYKDSLTDIKHKFDIKYDKRHLPVKIYVGDGKEENLLKSYLYTPEGKICGEINHGKQSWIKLYDYKNGRISELRQFKTDGNKIEQLENLNNSVLKKLMSQAGENVFVEKYDLKYKKENKKIVTVIDALNTKNIFEYDCYGNLTEFTDGNGETVKNTYTRAGHLFSEESFYGGKYEYSYNSTGLLEKRGEAGAAAIDTEYYSDGSVKCITDRYGKRTLYNYDNRGRVASIQGENQTIWYEYDCFDRIIKHIYGKSPEENSAVYYITLEYSENDRKVIVTEGGKYKTINESDAFGNIIKKTDGKGNSKSFQYNSLNQLSESVDPYGNQTLYEYNALGKIERIIEPDNTEKLYEYNHMGLLEIISDACGVFYKAEYDAVGRLRKEFIRPDSEKIYEYDAGGRIIKVLCGGQLVEAYDYSDHGKRVTVTDGNGEKYFYDFDSFGRLSGEQNRSGNQQKYYYDNEGKVERKDCFNGSLVIINNSEALNKRTVKYSDGDTNYFVYDSIGNLAEVKNACGKTEYFYDKGGRLISQKDITTGEEISYEYDSAGNRIRLYGSNREISYIYGKNNEVIEIFDNKQRLHVKLNYNKKGQEVLRIFGNGTVEETLYDKAGRVIVKTHKSEAGQILWGEGYVYGTDGKRTASVDNQGRVTLYEYNKCGQLEKVYYPYTEEQINNLKHEAQINGLAVNTDAGENRFLSASEKNSFIPLLNSMQYGLAYNLTNLQVFIKESYLYDGNGNRIAKSIPYGTINYSYDKDNCLISSGSHGQIYVNYTYDKMGNLLTEKSNKRTVKYSYNSQNRLIYCEVIDNEEKTYSQTAYAYDALGRRIIVQDKDETAIRTLYDGFTFEVIKQGPTHVNGLFTDSAESGIHWKQNGRPTGGRYRYLDDSDKSDGSRYCYLDGENYKNAVSRYQGERSQLMVNGTIAAQSSNEGIQYFSTDLQGSVVSVTDGLNSQKISYTYDAFGSLIQGKLTDATDLGYLGKQQDPASRLYNYGYRDYSPQTARFTTQDPIRDGMNWFAYCGGDPINFVDFDGLFFYKGNTQVSYKATTVYVIRNNDGVGNEFNSSVYIRKEDVFGNVTYSEPYTVGANCKPEYNGSLGSTTPDGEYYLTSKGTDDAPLYSQSDGTTNSTSYKNVLSIRTSDQNLTQEQRDTVNIGDRLLHADEKYNSQTGTTAPYNTNRTPGSAGCIINHTQEDHDKMMTDIMDGVTNPEAVTLKIYSLSNMECGK